MVFQQSAYQLLSICWVLAAIVFNSGYLFYAKANDTNLWMIPNNQYAVVLSINNTIHSAIKGNLAHDLPAVEKWKDF